MEGNKLKLAYISPLPPEKTGIAFYSKELLPYLKEYYDITVVIDQNQLDKNISENYPAIHYQDFMKNFKQFDRILYQFGNSPFHKHMIYMIEEIPGVVVLHDVFISSLIYWCEEVGYYPNLLIEESYYSHGLTSLIDLKKDVNLFKNKYPLNKRIIDNSIGVIFHNNFALEIMKNFYSVINQNFFEVIPQIRKIEEKIETLKTKDILISSFGYIASTKMPEIIIQGFALSKLSKIENIKLCFVGEESLEENYKNQIMEIIKRFNLQDKVIITGFVDEEKYNEYLKNTFIAIQLRRNSKGETSRAVLDVLAFGKPLILNKYASFKEIKEDSCYFVPENPTAEDIAEALDKLYFDKDLREKIAENGYNFIKQFHNPEYVAEKFYQVIEKFYKNSNLNQFLEKIANNINEKDMEKYAYLISKNFIPPVRNKNIFFDISNVALQDLKTGIERVAKAELKYMLQNPPNGYRVEPVKIFPLNGKWEIYKALSFAKNFIQIEDKDILKDSPIKPMEGDIYYISDLNHNAVIEAYKAEHFHRLKLAGVKIVSMVYDLLPIEFPEYFPPPIKDYHIKWLKIILEMSDKIICISNSVAQKLAEFAKQNGYNNPNITYLHLGSDISTVKHEEGLNEEDLKIFENISQNPYFLMVSTIEPRKGHLQTIKAFEILWDKGLDYNLVIVGKQGWMVDEVIKYINEHKELNKRLFWLGYVSDDLMDRLYKNAVATIMASEGEGFGLSIIESAYYKTPIIARDIDVFREIAKDGAYYFKNTKEPKDLADDLERWINLYKENKHPKPDNINWLTWEEHTEKLKEILVKDG